MKRIILIAGFILILTALSYTADASEIFISAGAGFFVPTDSSFNDIYGSGLFYTGELNIEIKESLFLWLEGGFFTKSGKLTYTEEETTVKIIPLVLGLKYTLVSSGTFDLYAGGGAAYHFFNEENPIGEVSDSGLGFIVEIGGMVLILKDMLLDINLGYTTCSLEPVEQEIKIGGLRAGISLAYRF